MSRFFTQRDVHSARLLMTASPAAVKYFDEQLQGLTEAIKNHPKIAPEGKKTLRAAVTAFEQRKAQVEARMCEMGWVWQEQRPWNPEGASRLVEAGFASGQLDHYPASAASERGWVSSFFWPARVDSFRGAWTGPVYVLTDGKTGSSAEMFTATMRDNLIAKMVGTPTVGAGAGFMVDEPPVELPHSHLRFQIPNCVRLRADGTNEVAGIKPDIPVLPTEGEDPRGRATRALETIEADLVTSQALK